MNVVIGFWKVVNGPRLSLPICPPYSAICSCVITAGVSLCECGGRIRPHICWFGEVPFELDRIYEALDACTLFVAVGTSGVVEPAASFVAHVNRRARTIYVGPEEPANVSSFTECYLGKAGEVLPDLLAASCA